MADRIRGFTIDLGLDSSDIDRGMANLQRKLKTSNAQMKANLSSFKDAEESVEKYGTKIEGLNKKLTQQGRIVEKSKQKLDHLKNSQSQMSDKLEQAAKASKQAQANYKSLEKTYESMNNELKEHTNKVKEAQNTQKQMQNTVTQLSAKTKNAKGSFDVLNKEFKELKASGSASKQELTQLGNKVKEASLTYKSLSASLDSAKTDLNESKAATAQAKNELQDFKQANEGAMASAKASMQVAKKEAQSAERSYASLNREMAQLPSKIDKAEKEVYQQSFAFNVLKNKIDETNDEYDEFQRKQRGFGKMIASLGNFGDNFGKISKKVNQIGDSFRNVGYIVSGTVQGTIIANLSTIVPVAGSAVSAIAGIGGAATAAAGGAVALGGAFGIAGAGAYAMVGMSKRALTMLEDDMLKATTEVKNYQKSLKGIQQEFDALVRSNQAHIFNTMTNGINAGRHALQALKPAINEIAILTSLASQKFKDWVVNGKNMQNLFGNLNKYAPVIFNDILHSVLNFVDGTVAVVNQLFPLFKWASQGFQNMSLGFQKWANSVQGSQAIQGFVNYTKTNLPIVGSIFGNIFGGIVSLFKAFSGHSHKVLVGMQQVTETFRNWANNLAGTKEFKSFIAYLETNGPIVWQLLKNIGMVAVGVIKGLAPVGSVLLKIATAITGLVAKVTNAHPAIGALLGVFSALVGSVMVLSPQIILLTTVLKTFGVTSMLTSLKTKLLNGTLLSTVKNSRLVTGAMKAMRVAATFMLGPWGLVIAGVVALGAALVTAYKKSETFRNIVNRAFNAVKIGVMTAVKVIKTALNGLFQLLKGNTITGANILNKILPPAAVNAIKIGIQAIRSTFMWLFNFLYTQSAIIGGYLKTFWKENGSTIISTFIKVKNIVWNTLKVLYSVIIKPLLKGIGNAFRIAFGGIKSIVINTFNGIKLVVKGGLTVISGIIKLFKGIFTGNFKSMWVGVKQIFSGAIKVIRGIVKLGFGNMVIIIKTSLKLMWNAIKTIWSIIKNIVITTVKAIWLGIKKFFGLARTVALTIFRGLGKILGTIWNGIKKVIIFAAKSIWTGIKKFFTLARQVAVSIFKGLGGILGAIWRGISRVVVAAAKFVWSGIKKWFTLARKVTLNIFKGVGSFLGKIWNGIKNTVVKAVKNIVTMVRKKWSDLLTITKYRFGKIKLFILKIWLTIKNTVIKYVSGFVNGIRKKWSDLYNYTRHKFSLLRGWLIKTWTKIKVTVVKIVGRMWNGIKKIFENLYKGIRKIITNVKNWIIRNWNTIKSKVTGIASKLWAGIKRIFSNLYKGTRNIFGKVRNWLVRTWNSIRSKLVNIISKMWSGIKKIFSNLYKGTRNLFKRLSDWLVRTWNNIKSKVTRTVSNMWKGIKSVFNNLWKGTKNIFSNLRKWLIDNWGSIKNKITGIASSLWKKVSGTFNKMKNGIKSVIGKIKGHINGMVDKVKKGLNKLINGVNWVAEKIGMKPLPTFKFSTGTESTHTQNVVTNGKVNRDVMATVGDKGKGNGPGGFRHETIIPPRGKPFITPNRDTTMPISKGTRILNGQQTHQMLSTPRFASGTFGKELANLTTGFYSKKKKAEKDAAGMFANGAVETHKVNKKLNEGIQTAKATAKVTGKMALDKGMEAGSKMMAFGKDIYDWATNPGKLVDKVLKKFGVNFDFMKGGLLKNLMGAAYKKLKSGVKSLFAGWLEDSGGADLSSFSKYPVTTPYSPSKPIPWYPFGDGRHYGIDYGTPVGTKITAPTSGTLSEQYNTYGGKVAKLVSGKFTQFFLHLSRVLKEGHVEQGDPIARTGNSGKWTTGPHLHYQVEKGKRAALTNQDTIDPDKFADMGGGMGRLGHLKGSGFTSKNPLHHDLGKTSKKVTTANINKWLSGTGMAGLGSHFMRAGRASGLDPRYLVAHAAVETGWGSSNMSLKGNVNKGNWFGIGAFDNNPNNGFNYGLGIVGGAKWIRKNFYNAGQRTVYKMRHNNGVHEYATAGNWDTMIASIMNNSKRFMYKTGGYIKNNGFYNLGDGGYPEWVIPTDPNRRTDAMKLLALAAKDIEGRKTNGNKRPSQFSSRSVNNSSDNTELLLRMIENQQQQINVLMDIARSNSNIEEKPTGILDRDLEQAHNRHQDRRERRKQRSNAFAGGAF